MGKVKAATWRRFVLYIVLPGLLLCGCATPGPVDLGGGGEESSGAYRLREGDPVVVIIGGIPVPISVEDIVNEHGEITLPYINDVHVLGMTSSELENHLHSLYVPDYFRMAAVNCLIPTERSYYLYGEIRGPGRYQYTSGMTILQAIAGAGGFTEFAKRSKVELLRGETQTKHNIPDIRKHPEKDFRLEPGDIIIVPRSTF